MKYYSDMATHQFAHPGQPRLLPGESHVCRFLPVVEVSFDPTNVHGLRDDESDFAFACACGKVVDVSVRRAS